MLPLVPSHCRRFPSGDLIDQTARLIGDSEMSVVILPGNHDPLTPDSVYRRGGLSDPNNVKVIGLHDEDANVFAEWGLEIWGNAPRNSARPQREKTLASNTSLS